MKKKRLTHGSLFTGIGGFDLAASWVGWQNVFQCEIDPFCQIILKSQFPHCEIFTDIKTSNFNKYHGTIDVISGGFPCQPFSLAGRQKGTDDERYLWHEMLRAIREVEPQWVIAENVFGLLAMQSGVVFERVCVDLEDAGYEVGTYIIPACAVDAPHRRDRVWIVAHACRLERQADTKRRRNADKEDNEQLKCSHNNRIDRNADSHIFGEVGEICKRKSLIACGNCEIAANADGERTGRLRNESQPQGTRGSDELFGKQHSIPNWDNFPTQSPVCRRNDGISFGLADIAFSKWRNESIKALGNAIVPQVAYQIFKAIENVTS